MVVVVVGICDCPRVLPAELGNTRITELNVDRNQLHSLPASLAANDRLRVIRIEEVGLRVSFVKETHAAAFYDACGSSCANFLPVHFMSTFNSIPPELHMSVNIHAFYVCRQHKVI